MSAQTESVTASSGQPEKWNLKTNSVGNANISGTSGSDNQSEESTSDVTFIEQETSAKKLSPDSSGRSLELKLEEICVHTGENRGELQKLASDITPDGNVVKRKRHASTTHLGNHKQLGRKRRKTTDRGGGSHRKFLMGGTVTDPLNLNSLCDESISSSVNAATPISSPLPHVNKDPNPAIVPLDVRDPLKLNTVSSETDDGAHLTRTLTSKSGGKKRKKWLEKVCESHSADEATIVSKPLILNLEGVNKPLHHASASKITDKIVSPVIPECGQMYRKRKKQDPTTRTARALLIDTSDTKPKEASPEKKAPPHSKERITPEKRKYKRQTSKESKQQLPKFKDDNKKFQYGNYHRYYGYRNPDQEDDPRIPFFKKEWFQGKMCLDIGCNSGHLTLYIAKVFEPERITGIDIDGTLIKIARKNIRHCLDEERNPNQKTFPVSMQKLYGQISSSKMPSEKPEAMSKFPRNVLFRCANFVSENETLVELQKPEYDTILCLSVTKWIHLNWGDAGLKRMFRRIFLSLRPGGRLILEPQGWPSYIKKKKLTETIYKNFRQIQLKPEKFKDYLLSSRVGFSSCETIGTPVNKSKGFRRPILMFTKLTTSRGSTSDKPKAKPCQGRTSSETGQGHATSTRTCQGKVPSTGDPAATDATTHGIVNSSSVKKLDDSAGLSTDAVILNRLPKTSVVNIRQVAQSDECSDTKAPKTEGLGTEKSKNKRKVEDDKDKEEPKDNARADEVNTGQGNDTGSPPVKKMKTESTD